MHNLSESLKSSPIYLRTCIQYEVLDSVSCWDSYKRFCKKLGNDVMEYMEFEFWFMRFYNGEIDMEYDRSKEPKKRAFMNLPVKIFNKIAEENLKPMDRILLRQVSPDLQSFCDKLDPKFKKIQLKMEEDINGFVLGKEKIEYKPLENGYVMSSNGVNVTVNDGDWLDGMWNGLVACFNSENPKYEELRISVDPGKDADWKRMMERYAHRIHPELVFKVKSVDFMGTYFEDGPQLLLPLFQPGYLENIAMLYSNDNVTFEKLAETEQWKQAKSFIMEASFIGPLRHLCHFKEFAVFLKELSVKDIRQMKETLFKSPNLEMCMIVFNGSDDFDGIEEGLFADFILQEQISSADVEFYHYPIPNSSDYFEIEVQTRVIKITRKK